MDGGFGRVVVRNQKVKIQRDQIGSWQYRDNLPSGFVNHLNFYNLDLRQLEFAMPKPTPFQIYSPVNGFKRQKYIFLSTERNVFSISVWLSGCPS